MKLKEQHGCQGSNLGGLSYVNGKGRTQVKFYLSQEYVSSFLLNPIEGLKRDCNHLLSSIFVEAKQIFVELAPLPRFDLVFNFKAKQLNPWKTDIFTRERVLNFSIIVVFGL